MEKQPVTEAELLRRQLQEVSQKGSELSILLFFALQKLGGSMTVTHQERVESQTSDGQIAAHHDPKNRSLTLTLTVKEK